MTRKPFFMAEPSGGGGDRREVYAIDDVESRYAPDGDEAAMNCPRCAAENPPAAKFCRGCGARLDSICPACAHANLPGSRFCNECGHQLVSEAPGAAPVAQTAPRTQVDYTPKHLADKILKARSALEGERRQVTVLFADLAGFTTLAESRDPEEVHALIDRCFAAISAEIHRFEGSVHQYTGDGVMTLFGAPVDHAGSPRRAVRAAAGRGWTSPPNGGSPHSSVGRAS